MFVLTHCSQQPFWTRTPLFFSTFGTTAFQRDNGYLQVGFDSHRRGAEDHQNSLGVTVRAPVNRMQILTGFALDLVQRQVSQRSATFEWRAPKSHM